MNGQAWVTCPSREGKIIRRGIVKVVGQIKTIGTLVYLELDTPRMIF